MAIRGWIHRHDYLTLVNVRMTLSALSAGNRVMGQNVRWGKVSQASENSQGTGVGEEWPKRTLALSIYVLTSYKGSYF